MQHMNVRANDIVPMKDGPQAALGDRFPSFGAGGLRGGVASVSNEKQDVSGDRGCHNVRTVQGS